MSNFVRIFATAFLALLTVAGSAPLEAGAQRSITGRAGVLVPDTLSVQAIAQIRDFYAAHPSSGVKALPPGIRRNLERGKTLPPGIAKRAVPRELLARLRIAEGFELVEVGLDVILVEVATNVIHDVLLEVIRNQEHQAT